MTSRLLLEKIVWAILIFSLSGSILLGNPPEQRHLLSDVLDHISEVYQVIFTYDAATLSDITVDFDFDLNQEEDLELVVNRVLASTGLKYKYVGEKYFIIFNDTKIGNRKARKLNRSIQKIQQLENSNEILLQKKSSRQTGVKQLTTILDQSKQIKREKTIAGKVTDEEGLPLVGATVLAKGTIKGALTDEDGKYELTVPDEVSTLVFSYIGHVTKEVEIGTERVINMVLPNSVSSLDEVVVIGYGTRTRADLTGAVSSVDADDIAKSEFITPELAMQGRMAGVFVGVTSGDPTSRPEVRIRGVGTIGFNDPLYVIDGVPVTEFGSGSVYTASSAAANDIRGSLNIFNLINPNDIESISVLKDASAAAIYGVRAANGVVLITTKRGSAGKPQVDFKLSRGIANVPNTFDVLNTADFTALHLEMYNNNPVELPNMPPQFNKDSAQYLGDSPTYDWQEELLNRNAVMEDYAMTISGGNPGSTYAFSVGYSHSESALKFNETDRYTLGLNSDHQLTKWLRVGESFRLAYIDAWDQRNITGNTANLNWAYGVSPWQHIFDPNGPNGFAPNRVVDPENNFAVIDDRPYGPETDFNLFGAERLTDTDWTQLRNLGSAYIELRPFTGFSLKGTFSADWYYTRRNTWLDVDVLNFRDGNPEEGNTYGERHNRNHNLAREVTANYNNQFGDHSIDLLLNGMWQDYGVELVAASRLDVFSDDPNLRIVAEGDRELSSASTLRELYALQGYMARFSYNFANKYYLDATVRRDGTSRFAPEYRWGTFPSFSAAWRVTEEGFMKNVKAINDLKVRGGWGQLGNQETRPYAFLSLISLNPRFPTGPGPIGTNNEGAFLPDFPVINLSWETSTTTSIGFDGVFFNNSLNVTAEYYSRFTEGILQAVALPMVVGNTQAPVFNIASVRNSGFEFVLGYNFKLGDVSLDLGGNLTTVKNEVVELANGDPVGGNFNRIEEGLPLNYLWGFQAEGIFQNQGEVDTYVATTTDQQSDDSRRASGDMYFADLYGPSDEEGEFRQEGADGVVNTLDQTFLGNTIPGYFYGFNLGANWKGLDLSVFFQGIGDVQKVNNARWRGESMSSMGINQWSTTKDRWTPANPSETMPRAMAGDPTGNTRFSSRWVEDAGFLRLKNVQLGYNLPPGARNRLGNARNIRLYLSGTNLLLFTPWSGVDPENDVIPPPRIYTLGLNLSF
ncbi:MAG: TonB-dependent receptor [Bacteroidota bacterium]